MPGRKRFFLDGERDLAKAQLLFIISKIAPGNAYIVVADRQNGMFRGQDLFLDFLGRAAMAADAS